METAAPRPRVEALELTGFAHPTPAQPAPEEQPVEPTWPQWQRVLFRFFFVYFVLRSAVELVLRDSRRRLRPALLPNGRRLGRSRQQRARLSRARHARAGQWQRRHVVGVRTVVALSRLAAIGCVVWTMLDRKRPHYERLVVLAAHDRALLHRAAALSYGIIKLFVLQMPFPALSQLATPLGDLLPMRFSWLFIGYSVPYQFFSGAMETTAGLLLLYRRTVTAGLFAATGAFMNVVMINLAYDVPVKLYASHLLFSCLFLLALDSRRLIGFLVLNQAAPPTPRTTRISFGRGSDGRASR